MPTSHTEIIQPGAPWPPVDEVPRLNRQKIYRTMFNHSEPSLLVRGLDWKSKPVETFTSAFIKMVAISYANLLVGESVAFSLGEGKPEQADAAVRRVLRQSKFGVVAFNAAIGQSVEGRTYLKVRRGQRTSRHAKEVVLIENLWAQSVFRLTDHGSTTALGFVISNPVCADDIHYTQFEIHYPGEIHHELWSMEGGNLKEKANFEAVLGYLPVGITDPMGGVQQTDVDDLLVIEIDNLDTNGWSIPDLHSSENVIRLLEDRLSRDSEILNKHANPKLAVPPGVLDDKGQVRRTTFDGMMFEMGESGLMVPQYVTWEPRISESFEYWDKLIGVLLANTGLTHQIVGLESKSGFADSGTALRLRMIPTLAMVNAKKLHLSPAFTDAIRMALQLADGFDDYGSTALPDEVEVTAQWRDGIPEDPVEAASVTRLRTSGARTMSTRRAIKFHDPDMSEDSIDEELEAIAEDESAAVPAGLRQTNPRTVMTNLDTAENADQQ